MVSILFLISSCAGTWDSVKRGVTGAKSNSSDEFLVEKKDPLVLPPDFEKLPTPGDQDTDDKSDELDVKDLLEIENNDDENNSDSSDNLIDNILKKIQ